MPGPTCSTAAWSWSRRPGKLRQPTSRPCRSSGRRWARRSCKCRPTSTIWRWRPPVTCRTWWRRPLRPQRPSEYVTLTAGGWQDTTRIAAGDPHLWRQIMLANRTNLLASLDVLSGLLAQWRDALDAGRRGGRGTTAGRGKAHTRCCGKLTFIRRRASPTGPARRWRRPRPNWGWLGPPARRGRARLSDPRRARRTAGRPDRPRTAGRQRRRAADHRPGRRRPADRSDVSTSNGHDSAANWQVVHVLPKPGVMDPGGAKRAGGHRRLAAQGRRGAHAAQVLARRPGRRRSCKLLCAKVLANDAIEQVDRRAAAVRPAGAGLAVSVRAASRCRCARWTTTALMRAEPRGAALSCRSPRCRRSRRIFASWAATRPTSSWKRSPRPGASIAATRRWPAGLRIATRTGERQFDNLLKETIFAATQRDSPRAGRRRLVRQRLRRQCRRRPVRRRVQRLLQGRNAQSSLGPRALRRREHGPRRRDSRSAGHRPGRQADLQHRRLLLRPARHAARDAAAGRAASAAGDARASSPACAITATGWAFRRSTARSISIRATWAIRSSSAATSA